VTNCSPAYWKLLPEKEKNTKINSDEKRAIFTLELPSALWLTMGFSNIYLCILIK